MEDKRSLSRLREFYNGKRVYITGITGFHGTWLALVLKELGAEVRGLGLKDSQSMSNIVGLNSVIPITYGRIESSIKYAMDISTFKPEILFNLAKVIDENETSIDNIYRTNVMGTLETNILLKELDTPVSLININPIKSRTIQNETSPIKNSLNSSDKITREYSKKFEKLNSCSIYVYNAIGGGDFGYNSIVRDVVNSINSKKKLNTDNIYSGMYKHIFDIVLDVLEIAIDMELDNDKTYQVYTNEDTTSYSRDSILSLFKRYMPLDTDINEKNVDLDRTQLIDTEVGLLCPNITEVIRLTSLWYNFYLAGTDMYDYTAEEIKRGLESYSKRQRKGEN